MKQSLFFCLVCCTVIFSCKKGDGDSHPDYLSAFCNVYIDQSGLATRATLDDATVLDIAHQGLRANATDTTIRSVIVYAWVEGRPQVYSNTPALCMTALPAGQLNDQPHDPVRLTSIWKSSKYINMQLAEMTAGRETHFYDFCIDSLQSATLFISLLHRQPTADPQAYTEKRYLSIPLLGHTTEAYDSIRFSIFTYDGPKVFSCAVR